MVSEDLFNNNLSADRILSFVNILKITSKTDEFQKWMNDYHHIEVNDELLEGYKFFMSVCIRGIINSVIYEDSLNLNEDFTFFRARFVGVGLEDLPNTCEKTVFIKNIWPLSRQVKKAKNWKELNNVIENINEIIFSFDHFFEKNVAETEPLNKDEFLKILTIIYTHIFLNDTSEGIPHIYQLTPILKSDVKEQYMRKAYLGYVYTLQYLWFVLLGEKRFNDTSLKELHKAHILYSETVDNEFQLPFELSELESVLENQNFDDEESANIETMNKWLALDYLFGKINEEVVSPMRGELKNDIIFHPLLNVKSNYDKKLFEALLQKEKISEPEYLKGNVKGNLLEKLLDYLFLWYNVDVLDSQELTLFNGLPSFISTLLGAVESSRIFAQGDIVSVLKFKHPIEEIEGYDYSYAILVHVFSGMAISDHSGWLVFYDCASDSGSSELLLDRAEYLINSFVEKSKVEIKTEVVDKDRFKEYLAKRTIFPDNDKLNLVETKKKVNNFVGEAKGKLFEYAFCNWLFVRNFANGKNIKFDILVNGEQIDAYEEFENSIDLFECKVQVHIDELDDTISQVKRKVESLKCLNKKINSYLIVYSPVNPRIKNKIQEADIIVRKDFKTDLFDRLNSESKKKLSQVLEFEFDNLTER